MEKNKFCIYCFEKYKYSGKKPKCTKKCKTKTVFFMRGIHSCGKSYTAKLIAGRKGVVIETDAFFGKPGKKFHFQTKRRKEAREWTFKELKFAIKTGVTTIVIDRGNAPASYSKKLMHYAIKHGYRIELAEPITKRWQDIKYLIHDGPFADYKLRDWSVKLAEINSKTHHVKADKIYKRLMAYDPYVTVEDFLNYTKKKKNTT